MKNYSSMATLNSHTFISELGDTGNSSSFQNLPSTSLGQMVQTSPVQFFTVQALTNASIPH